MTAQDHQAKRVVASDTIRVRMQPELRGAISKAADRRSMTDSAWIRSAALTVLMLEGIGTIVKHEDDLTDDPS